MAATIDRRPLTESVLTRLKELAGVSVYDGEMPSTPPTIPGGQRVAPYVIVHPLWGGDSAEEAVARDSESGDVGWHVTCVAGHRADVEHLASRVNGHLWGWKLPVADGLSAGRLYPPPGYQAPVIPETSELPPRHSVPLQYRTAVSH